MNYDKFVKCYAGRGSDNGKTDDTYRIIGETKSGEYELINTRTSERVTLYKTHTYRDMSVHRANFKSRDEQIERNKKIGTKVR